MNDNDGYWGEWVYLKMQKEHLVEHQFSQSWCISEDSTESEALISRLNTNIDLSVKILLGCVRAVQCSIQLETLKCVTILGYSLGLCFHGNIYSIYSTVLYTCPETLKQFLRLGCTPMKTTIALIMGKIILFSLFLEPFLSSGLKRKVEPTSWN